MKSQYMTLGQTAIAGFVALWLLERFGIGHHAGAGSAAAGGGAQGGCNTGAPNCSCTANSGSGNSPGWYTAGANASSGSGWGGAPGHHHCDWNAQCCFCTDVPKCIKSGVPPTKKGSCRPDWGTAGYVQAGGPYPKTADFSQCPAGTGPPGDNT